MLNREARKEREGFKSLFFACFLAPLMICLANQAGVASLAVQNDCLTLIRETPALVVD
jgi:hypothetical protein